MMKITYILGICTNIYNVMEIKNDFQSLHIFNSTWSWTMWSGEKKKYYYYYSFSLVCTDSIKF